MTDIAIRDTTTEIVSGTNLAAWAEEASQAARVAVSLSKTPFVPASLRDRNPEVTAANVTAALLTGHELGLSPMASLRSIDLIQGVPALRAITLRAIVLSQGHEMWVEDSTATRAIVKGRRQGSEQVQSSTWTLDRARGLGLLSRDQWKKQPGAMLVARATSECARLIAADAILGIAYSAEELDDGADQVAPGPDAAPAEAAAPRRTAQRRTRGQAQNVARPPVAVEEPPAAAPEPDFDDEPITAKSPAKSAPATEPDTSDDRDAALSVPMISDRQLQKMVILYGELGMKNDREGRLADASTFLDRELSTAKDLTRDEATRLIDDLERRASTTTSSADPDPCVVCGSDNAKDEPHDEDLHAEMEQERADKNGSDS